MKFLSIVKKNRAKTLLSGIRKNGYSCYYMNDDYAHFLNLREQFSHKMDIRSLSGIFQETFQEIKEPFLELMVRLNKRYDSLEWWGGQIASRNPASTPLVLDITYVFCAKRILLSSDQNVIFIVQSEALSGCISDVAEELGYSVVRYRDRVSEYVKIGRRWLYYGVHILYFVWKAFQTRRAAFKLLDPLPAKKVDVKKRIVIRSWVTKGNFDKWGKFRDRNFGSLPEWLRSKNYEVWIMPMFFSLSMSLKEVFRLMKDQEETFLIPDHYLKTSDYARTLYDGFRSSRRRVEGAEMLNIDIAGIFNEVIQNIGFGSPQLLFNLCYPMLGRLKEKGFEIDGFYYAFEGNPPEKPFILGCRKHFPNSRIIGFQHTTFFPNQMAYHLGHEESEFHPLPHKIVCSGPIYLKLFEGAGFPREIITDGANLRFEDVYKNRATDVVSLGSKRKVVMLPLPGLSDHNLVFELLVKVKEALKDLGKYKVYIRTHPVLSQKRIEAFLEKIRMANYAFADEGGIQGWLPKVCVVISCGTSITILEAVAMGVPVIRVVPDNTFFYDPFYWPDYPLEPVNTASEIRQQLLSIEEILDNDKEYFMKIGERVLTQYFTKPTEENMKVFL